MIDIVVLYCNEKDEEWRKRLNEALKQEGSNDRQVTGEERYRDWDCFKYWFRGVEKNCKWVNKVFLVVACKSQVPKWLDTSNPKLKVVCHDEFIPEKILPTFNSLTIEAYLDKIKDLSNNYVYCNDDYFFINEIPSDTFFENGLPVYDNKVFNIKKYSDNLLTGSDATFYKILNNDIDFRLKLTNNNAKGYDILHLPFPNKKDFGEFILDTYSKDFLDANSVSKFRNEKNFSRHLFVHLYRDTKSHMKKNVYANSRYVTLKSDVDFNEYTNCDMVCFNDTEQLDDYIATKKKLIDFFESKFPNKCSFEKEV